METPLSTMSGWQVLLLGLAAALVATIPVLLEGAPRPTVHDEWGYLLAADTFAQGRLTNPTPKHWPHFETIHQLQTPSYSSKYPPAQSLFIALGQKLGSPIIGIWLSIVFFVSALAWMLSALFPRSWVLVGVGLATAQYLNWGTPFARGMPGYWAQSYWGGTVAAGAGALLYGALFRLHHRVTARHAALFGLALMLLATTRPKEGFIVAIPALIVLAVIWWRSGGMAPSGRRGQLWSALGFGGVVLLGGAGILSHNQAVTGSWRELPWQTHAKQYVAFPLYIWQDKNDSRTWQNPQLAKFHGERETWFHDRHRGVVGTLKSIARKLARSWSFYLGPLLTLPFLLALPSCRRSWYLVALAAVGLAVLDQSLVFAAFPHYLAPSACLFILLVLRGLQELATFGSKGKVALTIILGGAFLMSAFGLYGSVQARRVSDQDARHRIQRDLESLPGQHLVLVYYPDDFIMGNEYVFNEADLSQTKVLWARSLSDDKNQALLADFRDRKLWVLIAGGGERKPRLKLHDPQRPLAESLQIN